MFVYRMNYSDSCKFEEWAKENSVEYDELDDENYLDNCPECGEDEFWHNAHCTKCGYRISR